jgi:hypothetical protein
MTKLTALITSFIDFINNVLVPLVFAVAFIVFIFGVFRYFIAGAANPEKRKQGTELIMYSVIGFAVMMSIWGLVNLAIGTFGFDNTNRPCLPTFNATNDCAGNGTNKSIQNDNSAKGTSKNSAETTGSPATSPAPDPVNYGSPDPATGLPNIY